MRVFSHQRDVHKGHWWIVEGGSTVADWGNWQETEGFLEWAQRKSGQRDPKTKHINAKPNAWAEPELCKTDLPLNFVASTRSPSKIILSEKKKPKKLGQRPIQDTADLTWKHCCWIKHFGTKGCHTATSSSCPYLFLLWTAAVPAQ